MEIGLNGSSVGVSSLFFCSCMEASWLCIVFAIWTFYLLWRKRARTRRFQSPEPSKGPFFTFPNASPALSHRLREDFQTHLGANKRDLFGADHHPLTQNHSNASREVPFLGSLGRRPSTVLLEDPLEIHAALNPSGGISNQRKRYNMLMS